ncbi:MAG: hypothetical protein AAFX99_02310 [Myxococcota bacterium]
MAVPPEEINIRLIEVFSIGCGARAQGYGPLARQITDDLAYCLSGFDDLIARPHHLLGLPIEDLDPNLGEGFDPALDPDGELPDRIAFILFSSLPSDALVRQLTRERGAGMALSGRMVFEGAQVDLSMNLWDVGPPNLLWCRALFGALDQLPTMLIEAVGHLAYSLQAHGAQTLDAARTRVAQRVGTHSFSALRHYAAASDMMRRTRLDIRQTPNPQTLLLSLCSALNADPDYMAPQLMCLEYSLERLKAKDIAYAQALLERLSKLREPRLLFDLLRFEAHLCLDQTDSDARQLQRARSRRVL